MRRFIVIIFIRVTCWCLVALTCFSAEARIMDSASALKLVQAWGKATKDARFISNIEVDIKGGFMTQSSGGIFRYLPDKKLLLLSGVCGYKITIYSKHPHNWNELVRAGQREYRAMGDGEFQFELYPQQLFDLEKDVVLLTKSFDDADIDQSMFVMQGRWLLSAAHYWFTKRLNDVLVEPEELLIQQAEGINQRWPKRPW